MISKDTVGLDHPLHPEGPIREARRERVKVELERHKYVFELQGKYGLWLIGSLLLINGAGFGFAARNNELTEALSPHGFALLTGGLFFALCSGFASWWNWSVHSEDRYVMCERLLIELQYPSVRRDEYEDDIDRTQQNRRDETINATYALSIILGFISATCTLVAAWSAGTKLVS